jgi:hypothetical protein
MAFCNSCGSTVDPNGKFCTSCGAPMPFGGGGEPVPGAAPPPVTRAASSGGGGVLKIILIVIGIFVVLGIAGAAATAFGVWKLAKATRVQQHGERVRVTSPLGTVETNQNPEQTLRQTGVDPYPGATAVPSSSTAIAVGGMKTATAEFETPDTPQQVARFYKSRFPNASLTESQADHYVIVSTSDAGFVTITVEPREGKTHLTVAVVKGPPDTEESR